MCQAGPRWHPNHEIAWHIERLLLHVRYAKRLKKYAFSFIEMQLSEYIYIIMSQYSFSSSSNSSPNQISIFLENALYSSILCVIAFCCLNFHKNLQEKIREIIKFQQKGYTIAWISFHFRRWEEKMTWSNRMKSRLGVYCKLSLIRPPIDKPSPLAPVIGLHRHVPWTKRGTAKLFTIQRNYTPSLAAIKISEVWFALWEWSNHIEASHNIIDWFSNRTGTSVDDGKARGKD